MHRSGSVIHESTHAIGNSSDSVFAVTGKLNS
jgi:hypothetical protein